MAEKIIPFLLQKTPNGEKQLPLSQGTSWTLGRSDNNDFLILDQWMSRNHAIIKRNELGEFSLIDLGTRNGSFINDQRITGTVPLNNGDRIVLGQTHFEFRYPRTEIKSDAQMTLLGGQLTATLFVRQLMIVVVFDLRNFSQLKAQLDENQLSKLIGDWFSQGIKILNRYGSSNYKCISDSLMGLWFYEGETITQTATLKLFQALVHFSKMTLKLGQKYQLNQPLHIGVGMNIGYAMTDEDSNNTVTDYTPIGNTIDETFVLESSHKGLGVDIVLGDVCYDQCSVLGWVNDYFKPFLVKVTENEPPLIVYGSSFTELENLGFQDNSPDLIKQLTEKVCSFLLDIPPLKLSLSNHFPLDEPLPSVNELTAIREELQNLGVTLNEELQASLELLLGLSAFNLQEKKEHYEKSLQFWQNSPIPEHQTYVLYCLGCWWYEYAQNNKIDKLSALQKSRDYIQQSAVLFEKQKDSKSVGKIIIFLSELLFVLQQWKALETVAKRGVNLYQSLKAKIPLAKAYTYLAEVSLYKLDWTETESLVKKALVLYQGLTQQESQGVSSSEVGWCWLLKGRSLLGLGQSESSIPFLEKAKILIKIEESQDNYLQTLDSLKKAYFQQRLYQKSFNIKKEQFLQRYHLGYQSFTPFATEPPSLIEKKLLAENLALTGRQKEVFDFIERLNKVEQQLTVIYGDVAVGKSTYISHGLIPALTHKPLGSPQLIPIVQRNYQEGLQELEQQLHLELMTRQIEVSKVSLSGNNLILHQLQLLHEQGLMTVLVFDEFERFILKSVDAYQRKYFYQLLGQCLSIPTVKVILVIQETFVSYLLEYNRLFSGTTPPIHLLNENVFYYLDHFSPEIAIELISALVKRNNYLLEVPLIEKLVQELRNEYGLVRGIDIQIFGYLLENKQITQLTQYETTSKQALLEEYCQDCIRDCGTENEKLTWLVLGSLINEMGQEILANFTEIKAHLQNLSYPFMSDSLEIILKILTDHYLIAEIPDWNQSRYRLLQPHLLNFIQSQVQKIKEDLSEHQTQVEIPNEIKPKTQEIGVSSLLPPSSRYHRFKGYSAGSGSLFMGHYGQMTGLLYSPNGKLVVTASLDRTVNLWNPQGQLLQTCLGHLAGITRLDFSSNGKFIVSASADQTLKLWNLNGQEIQNFRGHLGTVTAVQFTPDSQFILSTGVDRTVKLWTLTGEVRQTFTGHTSAVTDLIVHPDGQHFLTSSWDHTLKLWTMEGEVLKTFTGHDSGVNRLALSPDGQIIISGGWDQTLRIWSLDGELLKTLPGHQGEVTCLRFAPDGEMFVSGGRDQTLKVWHKNGYLLQTISVPSLTPYALEFSPQEQQLLCCTQAGVKAWKWMNLPPKVIPSHQDWVNDLQWTVDDRHYLTGSSDKTIKLWNADGKIAQVFEFHEDWVTQVAIHPNGQGFASSSWDKTVKLWDWQGEVIANLPHEDTVNCVIYQPDGQGVVTGGMDKNIHLWSAEGQPLTMLEGHESAIMGLTFSPDGAYLLSVGMDKTLRLWTAQGELLWFLEGHEGAVVQGVFTPDSQRFLTASWDHTVRLWSIEGKLLQIFPHEDVVHSCCLSADGMTLMSGGLDQIIYFWSVTEGTLLDTINHGAVINHLSVSRHKPSLWVVDRSNNTTEYPLLF